RYLIATLLASLSTVVRPLGICCLIGIGVILLRRHEFKKFIAAVAIGASVGVLYVLPLAAYFGDPLATVHSYQGAHSLLFGMPFYAIIRGTLLYPVPVTKSCIEFRMDSAGDCRYCKNVS